MARKRINKMLRTLIYKSDKIDVGEIVATWRDASGWLVRARVSIVPPDYFELVHNGRLRTSSVNRTRLITRCYTKSTPRSTYLQREDHTMPINSEEHDYFTDQYDDSSIVPNKVEASIEDKFNDVPLLDVDANRVPTHQGAHPFDELRCKNFKKKQDI